MEQGHPRGHKVVGTHAHSIGHHVHNHAGYGPAEMTSFNSACTQCTRLFSSILCFVLCVRRYQGAKEAGALRLEGKEYVVQEVRPWQGCCLGQLFERSAFGLLHLALLRSGALPACQCAHMARIKE